MLCHGTLYQQTDLFSLKSIFDTILTGYWLYGEGPPPVTLKDKNTYETLGNELFIAGKFLDVSKLSDGNIIKRC